MVLHIQKYRLHTRRPNGCSGERTKAQTPQLVVLGGIWVRRGAGTCRECYDEASETKEALKKEIDELRAQIAFLKTWSPEAMDEGCSWIRGGPYISQRRKMGLMHLGLHHGEFSYVQNQ